MLFSVLNVSFHGSQMATSSEPAVKDYTPPPAPRPDTHSQYQKQKQREKMLSAKKPAGGVMAAEAALNG